MLATLRLALEALVLWLRIQAIRAHYTLSRDIEADIRADEARIATLRGGDPGDQLLGDRLRERILRAQGIVATLPAPDPAAGGTPAGGDAGRPLPADPK